MDPGSSPSNSETSQPFPTPASGKSDTGVPPVTIASALSASAPAKMQPTFCLTANL